MADADEIRARKRRSNRTVLTGLGVMGLALLISANELAPEILSTALGIIGFALLMYGVHLGWSVFYDREPEGPAT